jgi:outer membrane protein OmpA-like peptidoglycan-associated protein
MIKMRKRIALLFFLNAALVSSSPAQDTVYLTNPSFEDYARHSSPPVGWRDCGFLGESPPDTQPSGDFGVTFPPTDGKTYLGMVVRDNDTWEAVSQRISRPMKAGQCYEFSLHLARSPLYVSISRTTTEEVNFNRPVKVKIYGGTKTCGRSEQLAETETVKESRWMEYHFKLEPLADYSYITIEAFYETPVLFAYNGNVLVDNASSLNPIPCSEAVAQTPKPVQLQKEEQEEPEIAEAPSSPPPASKRSEPRASSPPQPEPDQKPEEVASRPTPTKKKEATISGIKRSEMTRGQTIRLDRLYFMADSSGITKESNETLEEVFEFLKENEDVKIEIGGHTNNLPPAKYCQQLSTARAKAVADYLIRQGISSERLKYKGYGKQKPIASNKTVYGRRRNQRVEIKILEIGEDG